MPDVKPAATNPSAAASATGGSGRVIRPTEFPSLASKQVSVRESRSATQIPSWVPCIATGDFSGNRRVFAMRRSYYDADEAGTASLFPPRGTERRLALAFLRLGQVEPLGHAECLQSRQHGMRSVKFVRLCYALQSIRCGWPMRSCHSAAHLVMEHQRRHAIILVARRE